MHDHTWYNQLADVRGVLVASHLHDQREAACLQQIYANMRSQTMTVITYDMYQYCISPCLHPG